MSEGREYVSSRRIGAADVTVISEGSCLWAPKISAPETEWRRAMPEADAEGRIPIGFNVAYLRLGGASIVIDPGFDGPRSAWQQRFAAHSPNLSALVRTAGLDTALARLGVAPGDVTHVLITHAHADHFAGVTAEQDGRQRARFPHARHILSRTEWDRNPKREDPASDVAVRLGAIQRLGLLDLVGAAHQVAPGVTMMASPGETPGHMIIRVQSAGARFYYLGDLFHHACEIEHPEWAPPGRDLASLQTSRTALFAETAETGASLVSSHEPFPGWGQIRRAAGGFRWQRTSP